MTGMTKLKLQRHLADVSSKNSGGNRDVAIVLFSLRWPEKAEGWGGETDDGRKSTKAEHKKKRGVYKDATTAL